MDKLISMVDFCQEVSKEFMAPKKPFDKNEWFGKILNYSDFLKQPLTLSMFVPCDLEDNFIKEYDWVAPDGVKWEDYEKKLLEAKERVLFEGIEYVESKKEGDYSFLRITQLGHINYPAFFSNLVVEDLVKYKIPITDSARKQMGL